MSQHAKFHPLTGERIKPIWTAPNGRIFWPILGGDDTVDPVPPLADPPADPAPTPPADPAKPATPPWGDDANFNAERAWKLIENLRSDAGKGEEVKRQIQEATEGAKKSIVEELGKALGLIQGDKLPTTEELAEQLKQEQSRNSSAAAATQSLQLENKVLKLAAPAGANPNALLDSRSFMDGIAEIDPADEAAVTKAITEAVKANTALAAQAAPFQGGTPGGFQPQAPQRSRSLGEAISRHYAAS